MTRWPDCFFNIWPFTTMKFCPKAYKKSQSGVKTLPNIKQTFQMLPKTSKFLLNWQNFTISGHTVARALQRVIELWPIVFRPQQNLFVFEKSVSGKNHFCAKMVWTRRSILTVTRFLNVLGNKFSYQSSKHIWQLFGLFRSPLLSKNCFGYFLGNDGKFWVILNSKILSLSNHHLESKIC